jgi:DNA polymerase
VRPTVVATLGSFATALLSGRALGITRVHGEEQLVVLGGRTVILYPLYHPAAALYTPTMLEALERDVARLPALLSRSEPVSTEPRHLIAAPVEPIAREPVQLGLF